MNSTQPRKSVGSRLLRGLSHPPRAKGRARLAVEPLGDRWLPAQLSFVTQPLPTAYGDSWNLARPPARAERRGAPEMGRGPPHPAFEQPHAPAPKRLVALAEKNKNGVA